MNSYPFPLMSVRNKGTADFNISSAVSFNNLLEKKPGFFRKSRVSFPQSVTIRFLKITL